jgi:hypothetical protein
MELKAMRAGRQIVGTSCCNKQSHLKENDF